MTERTTTAPADGVEMRAPVHVERMRSRLPLRFPGDGAFARVRDLLDEVGFTEERICERTLEGRSAEERASGAGSIYDFRSLVEGRTRAPLRDALDVLVRLFLDVEPVAADEADALLGAGALAALDALGLIEPDGAGRGHRATVLLYPTQGLLIVSDIGKVAEGDGRVTDDDAVYPAVTSNTRTYLAGLPRTRCERFLEMCGGTGIAALASARLAGRAWTADITERSTRFAEFNARLNELENVTAVCGDLYEPVRGLTFDRIVAHPPYVAEPERKLIYRDGGPDGEQVTRGLLAGLADHLEPGGRFYCTCIATDRVEAPLQQRVREMIGRREGEFDVVVVELAGHHPSEYYCRLAAGGKVPFAIAEQQHLAYKAMRVERMVYCTIAVQRHATPRAAFTLRRQLGAVRVGDAIEWLLAWATVNAERDLGPALLDARPSAPAGLVLRTEQGLQPGGWGVRGAALLTTAPFREVTDCTLDAAAFLARCDGTLTVREHRARLEAEGLMSPDAPADALVALVQALVGAGCLDLDGFRAPRPAR